MDPGARRPMDRGGGISLASSRIGPYVLPSELARTNETESSRPRDHLHAMDVDEVTSRPRKSTEDIQRELKRARLQRIQTMKPGPRIRNLPQLNRKKLDPSVYQMSEKMMQFALRAAEIMPQKLLGLKIRKLDIGTKEHEKVLSEKTEEVMHPCDSIHSQHVEDSKPPCEGYATANPETGAHLSELPSQQQQAKLPESFDSSNNTPVEYCASDEFIEQLSRQARRYRSLITPLSRKETIARSLVYMSEEASLAFDYYVREKAPFEGFDYRFGELLHHCFSFEEYRKVYTHYNFTIEMKKKDEECWTSSRYFAEVKLMFGTKSYFCSPLKLTDDGHCYSCANQGANELKHPSGGGFEKGREGCAYQCAYADDSSDDDECV